MLPQLEGFAAALLGALDAPSLTTVSDDLASFERAVLSSVDLRGVLSDTSLTGVTRARVVHEILSGKVAASTVRLVTYAAQHVAAPEVPAATGELAHLARLTREDGPVAPRALGLLAARRRVGGFSDALLADVDVSAFEEIEDDLFRWARTIDNNEELRRVLVDRDADLAVRQGLTTALLGGKVSALALELALYVVVGGRPRDVVGTLDYLVDYVAKKRQWRVARVFAARDIDDASQTDLVRSLSALTGSSVELQIASRPALLGGVVVEVGDLRLDASTQGRLSALRDVVSSGRFFESALSTNE